MSMRWGKSIALALLVCGAPGVGWADNFEVVHKFSGSIDNGSKPAAGLVSVGDLLYGTLSEGGSGRGYDGNGVVYSIDPTTGDERVLHDFAGMPDGRSPVAGLMHHNGILYGTTAEGGSANSGTLFNIDPRTRIETVLHSFTSADGASPESTPVAIGNILFGTAERGGTSNDGVVFRFDLTTGRASTLYSFAGGSDGMHPSKGLAFLNGTLYGVTYDGGSFGYGTIFSVDPITGAERILHSFRGLGEGGNSSASLLSHKGLLYGAFSSSLFSFDPLTRKLVVYAQVSPIDGDCLDGAPPTFVGECQYGDATCGGMGNRGTLYKVDPRTGAVTLLHTFDIKANGDTPAGRLLHYAGALYGTTDAGGQGDRGTVYKFELH